MHLLFRLEDSHDLANLLALVHDSAKQGDCVAHWLCSLIASCHNRDTMRLTACMNLHKRAKDAMALADLTELRDSLIQLALDTS